MEATLVEGVWAHGAWPRRDRHGEAQAVADEEAELARPEAEPEGPAGRGTQPGSSKGQQEGAKAGSVRDGGGGRVEGRMGCLVHARRHHLLGFGFRC